MTLDQIISAPALSAYWKELQSNTIPYLGPSLFPLDRNQGLTLKWIKGYNRLPIQLCPSAFDAQPTLRDRGDVNTVETRMPFFREAMRIGEEDRQKLLTLLNGNPAYMRDIVTRLYDDATNLIDGALVNPEIMRFELLQHGTIAIACTDADKGITVNYNYNYDPNGTWNASNVITAPILWNAAAPAVPTPIADILALKRQASLEGVTLTRAIVSPTVWAMLLTNSTIGKDVFPLASDASVSDRELQNYLMGKTGIMFTQYNKQYIDVAGVSHNFMDDDRIVFLPSNPVGTTYFGITPEEADLMNAPRRDAEVSVVGGGISVMTKVESGPPVNVVTSVSEIVLPSFERMDSVYVLVVA